MLSLPTNLFLIGYRGSGKTSVAAELAALLGWPWLDTDVEIERRAGKSIREIFADEEEVGFRRREAAVVAEAAAGERHVVALGGGAVLWPDNRQALAGRGAVVWLQASPQTLWQRIRDDPTTFARRPNLTAEGGLAEVERMLAQREPLYAAWADWIVPTEGLSPAEVARRIVQQLRLARNQEA
jgi:shikimate kinase